MNNNLMVILPCYNEERDIVPLVRAWQNEKDRILSEYELNLLIVAIDDGSTDNTRIVLESLVHEYTNVVLILHEVNKGLGQAIKTGISYFSQNSQDGDFCVTMDADNTHNPKFVFFMLQQLVDLKVDCVIASRFRKHSKVIGVPIIRKIMSIGACFFYTIFLRVPNVRDFTCGYRIYTAQIIKKAIGYYDENIVEQYSFACMMELLYKLHNIGATFVEVPFTLRYDYKRGESKMKVFKTIRASIITVLLLKNKMHSI